MIFCYPVADESLAKESQVPSLHLVRLYKVPRWLLLGRWPRHIYFLISYFNIQVALFLVQGTLYTFIQPAVDSHVATAAASHARARIMSLYSAFGLAGGFAGANGFSFLYAWNFRYSLFALGIGYGICVLIGGLLIRWAEKKYHWLYTPENG
jgi:MFS family permease